MRQRYAGQRYVVWGSVTLSVEQRYAECGVALCGTGIYGAALRGAILRGTGLHGGGIALSLGLRCSA